MRTPQEVAEQRRRDARWWTVHVLAAIGAVALVLAVALGVGFFVASRPGDAPVADATPGVTAPPTAEPLPTPTAPATSPTDLQTGDVWLPDLDLETEQMITQGVDVRNVRVRGTGARALDDGRVQFQHLDLEALVPFASVEQQVGQGLRLAPSTDGLVRVTLPLSAFGQTVDVAADARVTPEGDKIAIAPVRVVDAGFLGAVLERIPAFRAPIPNLPEGVRVTGITVVEQGFQVTATGQDVTVER